MASYRHSLPQLSGQLFLTDGGLETTLVFHEKIELPYFAAFDLMTSIEGRASAARVFSPLSADRAGERRRLHLRKPDLAREPRLGREARLLGARARRREPRVDRADGEAARRARDVGDADGAFRLRRPARRRLQARARR